MLTDAKALAGELTSPHPGPHIVLQCLLTQWPSATGQPDPRLHSVAGRWQSDAALEAVYDGCPSGSVRQQRGGEQELAPTAMGQPTAVVPEAVRALLEARTTTGRQACCPPLAGRAAQTSC